MKNYRIVRRRDGMYYIQREATIESLLSHILCPSPEKVKVYGNSIEFEEGFKSKEDAVFYLEGYLHGENPIEEIIDI